MSTGRVAVVSAHFREPPLSENPAFELAVQDPEGIAIAARLGADRIELCSALPLGGITPSLALIEVAAGAEVPVHVLVRPRPGGFEHTPAEIDVIVRDVRHARTAGAAGVVIGGVRDGRVDQELVRRVIDAGDGATVTFHRAFDTLPDPHAALETLVALGVDRILTSGGRTTVADCLPALAGLAAAAAGRIEIMAGGGVRPDLIEAIVGTGADAVHASAKRVVADATGVVLGTASSGATGRETTDEAEVRRILAVLRRPAVRPR